MMLKAIHVSRRRDTLSDTLDLPPGWYIRFTGDTLEWNKLREELKSWGWDYARWLPEYAWDDEKEGAWWIADELFSAVYTERFSNLNPKILTHIATDAVVQWIYKRKEWVGHSSSSQDREESSQRRPRPDFHPIPAHLAAQYRLLGLSGAATLEDVKEAYRSLAKQYHPDVGGTHHGFLSLHAAYEQVEHWVRSLLLQKAG